MLTEERRSRIQELLAQVSTVSIPELAAIFGTSEMTIRRDLRALELRGVCQRVHGGAMALRVTEYRNIAYPPFGQRDRCQVAEKVAIGRAAAALVRPGDVIAIDAGTTGAYMARALRSSAPITVITNSIGVLDQLQRALQVTVVCPGGTLSLEDRNSHGDLAFVGPIAVAALRDLRPKRAFITTSGLTVADGISNASLLQAEIKRVLIDIAEESILITDYTKFGRVHGFLVTGLSVFSKIITDTLAPLQDVEQLRGLGIEVVQVAPDEGAVALEYGSEALQLDHGQPPNGHQGGIA